MISKPHSPLLTGADAKRVSTRSANFFVCAESRGFFALEVATDGETAAGAGFDCPSAPAGSAPEDTGQHAKLTANANLKLTRSPLWQNIFRESIVETA
ncbi:MAG TPA: hypothetical protein VNY81_10005 [Candidatus Saccharimonadales bacterium]|nr:hypothetical protein [Candidatus Saccharimonadales bacterium]